jgi:hypothetical protein
MIVADRSLRDVQRSMRGAMSRMLAKDFRNLPRLTDEAMRARTLEGDDKSVGMGMPATVAWCEELRRRCAIHSDIDFSRVDPERKVSQCQKMLQLLCEEKEVLDRLVHLNQEDPIQVYEELVAATAQADALGMGQRACYQDVVRTSESQKLQTAGRDW